MWWPIRQQGFNTAVNHYRISQRTVRLWRLIFSILPEKSATMPRFVILTHDHPILHWDFMLENEAVLRTWRLSQPPAAGAIIFAEPLADHRLAYLDYEGPVCGNRGTVRSFDRGNYVAVEETADLVVVELSGNQLNGQASLRRLSHPGTWTFQFTPLRVD